MLLEATRRRRGTAHHKPQLHVVANDDPFAEIHAELRDAFAQVAALKLELDAAQARILAARDAYAAAHNYRIKPGVEALRAQFGKAQ